MRNIYMQVSVYKDIWKIYYHTSPISKREKTSATSARKHKLNKNIECNMKFHLFIFTLLLAAMTVFAYQPPVRKPPPGGWKPFPTFPGQGPYNPKIRFPH